MLTAPTTIAILLAAVVLGGCTRGSSTGAGTPSSPGPSSTATCSVVTAAQVSAALGISLTGPEVSFSPPAVTSCTYRSATPPAAVIVLFQSPQDARGFAEARATFEASGQPTTTRTGFGDEAFASTLGSDILKTTTLVARKGSLQVLISAPASLNPVDALMTQVLGNWPANSMRKN